MPDQSRAKVARLREGAICLLRPTAETWEPPWNNALGGSRPKSVALSEKKNVHYIMYWARPSRDRRLPRGARDEAAWRRGERPSVQVRSDARAVGLPGAPVRAASGGLGRRGEAGKWEVVTVGMPGRGACGGRGRCGWPTAWERKGARGERWGAEGRGSVGILGGCAQWAAERRPEECGLDTAGTTVGNERRAAPGGVRARGGSEGERAPGARAGPRRRRPWTRCPASPPCPRRRRAA